MLLVILLTDEISSSNHLDDDEEDLKYVKIALDESGSDVTLEVSLLFKLNCKDVLNMYCCNWQVTSKDEIIQTILIHYGLHKRKVFLDSLSEGLEVYKMYSLIPELFKPLFISKQLSSQDIIHKIVQTAVSLENDDHTLKLISTLFKYLSELSPNG